MLGEGGGSLAAIGVELLRAGMTYDLLGAAPGPAFGVPLSRHRLGLSAEVAEADCEALALQPGPHLASGACIGIEDALVLAEELARATAVDQALAAFENRRWERCRMVVQNSARLGEIEVAGGDKEEHGRIMRESLMALAQPI